MPTSDGMAEFGVGGDAPPVVVACVDDSGAWVVSSGVCGELAPGSRVETWSDLVDAVVAGAGQADLELTVTGLEFEDVVAPFGKHEPDSLVVNGKWFQPGWVADTGECVLLPVDWDLADVFDEWSANAEGDVPCDYYAAQAIYRFGDLYVVASTGDLDTNVPVGRFADESEGLRAAAAASDCFDFVDGSLELREGYLEDDWSASLYLDEADSEPAAPSLPAPLNGAGEPDGSLTSTEPGWEGVTEIETSELVGWVSGRTGVDIETVVALIALEEEYQIALGIMEAPDQMEYRYFDPAVLEGRPLTIDPVALALDANRFLGVPVEIAERVFNAETDYLRVKGLVDDKHSWLPLDGPAIVYGCTDLDEDHVWFVPVTTAIAISAVRVVLRSRTWGDFQVGVRRLDDAAMRRVSSMVSEDPPADDEPFDPEDYPGFADGDFPPHIGLLVPLWMPEDLLIEHARPHETIFNGTFWYVEPDDVDATVAALEHAGYLCGRDDYMIDAVFGVGADEPGGIEEDFEGSLVADPWQGHRSGDEPQIPGTTDPEAWVPNAVGIANEAAAQASTAWLAGRGLAGVIDELRWSDDSDPVPAPGLEEATTELDRCHGAACEAADTVGLLVGQEADADTVAAVSSALARADEARAGSERWLRRLAQLLLGVTTRSAGSDLIDRAERAAVVALFPEGETVGVSEDGAWPAARHIDELWVELAGLLCRMIVEHDVELTIGSSSVADTLVICEVDGTGNLTLRLVGGSHRDLDALMAIGWSPAGTELCASWNDPLVVAEPVTMLVATCTEVFDAYGAEVLALSIRTKAGRQRNRISERHSSMDLVESEWIGLGTLLEQARDLVEHSRYTEAGQILDSALERAREERETAAFGEVLLDLAELFVKVGRRDDALEAAEFAAVVFDELDLVAGRASANKVLGDAHSDLGHYERAVEHYQVALGLFDELGDEEMWATIQMEHGTVLSRTGAEGDAEEAYDRALAVFLRRWKEAALNVALCQQNRGSTLRAVGDLQGALAAHEQARGIFEPLGMRREVADCDVNTTNVLCHLGRLDEARHLNDEARSVYIELGLATEAADCDDHVGGILTTQGRYEDAIGFHVQARSIYSEHGFDVEGAMADYNLAHALHHLGQDDAALELLEGAAAVYLSHGSMANLADTELLLASVLATSAVPGRPLELVESARSHYLELGDEEAAAMCDVTLAEVLRMGGRAGDAVEAARRGLDCARDAGETVVIAEAEIQLGLGLADTGQPDQAKQHLDAARDLFTSGGLPLRAEQVPDPDSEGPPGES